jgi:RNA polymerase sigma factor (sigma-70 family)
VNTGHDEAMAAIATLFKSAAERLFWRARLLSGDRAQAEDLVQETFHEAIKNWNTLGRREPDLQAAWLFRVLYNKAVDQWRSGQRLHLVEMLEDRPSGDDVHHAAMCDIAADRAWKAIQAMPAVRRNVARLRWIDDREIGEIALELGIQPSTVRVHLKHARDTLRRTIGDDVPFLKELDDGVRRTGEETAS